MPKKLTPAARRHLLEVVQSPEFRMKCEVARMQRLLRATSKWLRRQTAKMYGGRWFDTLESMRCGVPGCKERGIHGHSTLRIDEATRAYQANIARLREHGLVRYEDTGSVFIGPDVDLEGKDEPRFPIYESITRALGAAMVNEDEAELANANVGFLQQHGVRGPDYLRILWHDILTGKRWLTGPMPAIEARQMAQQSRVLKERVRGLAVNVDFELILDERPTEPEKK